MKRLFAFGEIAYREARDERFSSKIPLIRTLRIALARSKEGSRTATGTRQSAVANATGKLLPRGCPRVK